MSSIGLLGAVVLGWAVNNPHVSLSGSHIAYYVDGSFCRLVLPHFHEDTFLSWQRFGCADLRTMLRKSFDVWEHNSHISFEETIYPQHAQIIVDVEERQEETLAFYKPIANVTAMIAVNPSKCWYTDHEFCYVLHKHHHVFLGVLVALFTIAIFILVLFVLRVSTRRIDSVLRLVAWALLLAPPMLYATALRPCYNCHDFMMVLMHEVGHALKLRHSDAPVSSGVTHYSGCQENKVSNLVATNTNNLDTRTIMHSVAQHRTEACLSRDDADAVRTLYGGACNEAVRCYDVVHFTGLSRLAVALVYAFVFSWGIVVLRNIAGRAWRRRKHKKLLSSQSSFQIRVPSSVTARPVTITPSTPRRVARPAPLSNPPIPPISRNQPIRTSSPRRNVMELAPTTPRINWV